MNWFAKGLMDDPLLDAFRYRRPAAWERSLATGALRLRGRLVRFLPVPPRAAVRPAATEHPQLPGGYQVGS